jgi:hypothetical protein
MHLHLGAWMPHRFQAAFRQFSIMHWALTPIT